MNGAPVVLALDRILDPVSRCFTPEVAQALLLLRTDADTQARMEELADKSTAGQLSAEERAEYETYVSAIDFLGVLQAKAKKLLAGTTQP